MTPSHSLSKQPRTLIVGASSGIGRALALQLAARGCEVIAVARRRAELEELRAAENGKRIHVRVCDTADGSAVRRTCEELRASKLAPEAVICSAGIGQLEGESESSVLSHERVFEVNYFGPLRWVEAWLEPEQPRTFVVISSLMAFFASPGAAAYCASKAAISATYESLALSHRSQGNQFLVVHPGPVDTAMLKVDRPLPFTQAPEECARKILTGLFAGRPQIDLGWPYTWAAKSFRLLPASVRRMILAKK